MGEVSGMSSLANGESSVVATPMALLGVGTRGRCDADAIADVVSGTCEAVRSAVLCGAPSGCDGMSVFDCEDDGFDARGRVVPDGVAGSDGRIAFVVCSRSENRSTALFATGGAEAALVFEAGWPYARSDADDGRCNALPLVRLPPPPPGAEVGRDVGILLEDGRDEAAEEGRVTELRSLSANFDGEVAVGAAVAVAND